MPSQNGIAWKRMSAEAVAIVASILVAFWIDAWWENRQQVALGATYEERIALELNENLEKLELHLLVADLNLEAARAVAPFFEIGSDPIDGKQLIIAFYNMGRDPPDRFDVSTYDDLVATGSLVHIRDVNRRHAIQQAYSELKELGPILRPYRQDYLTGLRGWIPQPLIGQIREHCVTLRDRATCLQADFELDEQSVQAIVSRFSSDSALLAYRLREQGLFEKRGRLNEAIEAVEAATTVLNQ